MQTHRAALAAAFLACFAVSCGGGAGQGQGAPQGFPPTPVKIAPPPAPVSVPRALQPGPLPPIATVATTVPTHAPRNLMSSEAILRAPPRRTKRLTCPRFGMEDPRPRV